MTGGMLTDVNRHYRVVRVAKRVELRSATRIREGGKTDQEGKRYRPIYCGNA